MDDMRLGLLQKRAEFGIPSSRPCSIQSQCDFLGQAMGKSDVLGHKFDVPTMVPQQLRFRLKYFVFSASV
jgi:hypothetical protein